MRIEYVIVMDQGAALSGALKREARCKADTDPPL